MKHNSFLLIALAVIVVNAVKMLIFRSNTSLQWNKNVSTKTRMRTGLHCSTSVRAIAQVNEERRFFFGHPWLQNDKSLSVHIKFRKIDNTLDTWAKTKHTHTHTHIFLRSCGLCPGLPGWAGTRTNQDFTEHTHTTVLRLCGICPGKPGWAGTRRNIHPLLSS